MGKDVCLNTERIGLGTCVCSPPGQHDGRRVSPGRSGGGSDADAQLGYHLYKRIANLMAERLHATRLQLLDVYGPRR